MIENRRAVSKPAGSAQNGLTRSMPMESRKKDVSAPRQEQPIAIVGRRARFPGENNLY